MLSLGVDQPVRFTDLLLASAHAVLLACACWTLAVLAAVVIEAVSAGRWMPARRLGCPSWLRRALVAAVASVLAGAGLVGPARAAIHRPGPRVGPAARVSPLEGLPLPDRPVDSVTPAGDPSQQSLRSARRRAPEAVVVVRPGDTLWGVAQSLLPSDAGPADVVRVVVALHRRNRAVIGVDPDLLVPGQRLVVPALPPDLPPHRKAVR